MKPLRMTVFGKAGCDKCKVMRKRVEELVAADDGVEAAYCDVETEAGLVQFCRAECMNPQRIPAVLMYRRASEGGTYEPVPAAPAGEGEHPVYGRSRLNHLLGLQTDYSAAGRGVVSPRMLRAMLKEARGAGVPG